MGKGNRRGLIWGRFGSSEHIGPKGGLHSSGVRMVNKEDSESCAEENGTAPRLPTLLQGRAPKLAKSNSNERGCDDSTRKSRGFSNTHEKGGKGDIIEKSGLGEGGGGGWGGRWIDQLWEALTFWGKVALQKFWKKGSITTLQVKTRGGIE